MPKTFQTQKLSNTVRYIFENVEDPTNEQERDVFCYMHREAVEAYLGEGDGPTVASPVYYHGRKSTGKQSISKSWKAAFDLDQPTPVVRHAVLR
jgi:hypothetical protein